MMWHGCLVYFYTNPNGKKMAKKPINDLSGIMSPEQIAKAKKHSAQITQEINENKKLQNDSLDSIAN